MLESVFSVKGAVESPQPGKSMRMEAMPASARAAAMAAVMAVASGSGAVMW